VRAETIRVSALLLDKILKTDIIGVLYLVGSLLRKEFIMSEIVNTSGQGKGSVVPEEVKAFNWGAFTLSWIWGCFNGTFITLIILVAGFVAVIPLIGWLVPFGLAIWFGKNGNEWAWQNKKWESIEYFHKVQKNWATVGIILAILGIISSMITTVFGFLFASAVTGAS